MDINTELVDAMMAIPPEEMKLLSKAELLHYRLDGTDANYDEKIIADSAHRYGTTSAIMRQRRVSSYKCGVEDYYCREATLWGISEKIYWLRLKSISKLCNENDVKKYDKCRIEVMNGIRK
jgi:hypothetical protein